MGNSLCKERPDRVDSKNRPVQRVLGSCPQMFSIGNKENGKWPSQVLETRPPSVTDTQSTFPGEWKNVTLRPVAPAVTVEPLPAKSITLPIVPPRRKKTEKLLKTGRPGGFKEVFGNVTRRSSCDSVTSVERPLPPFKRRNSGSDLANGTNKTVPEENVTKRTTLVRKISKVGNRKSDQFFGENLSDCLSDEPIVLENPITPSNTPVKSESVMLDEIDAFINSATATVQEIPAPSIPLSKPEDDVEMPSLNKKAEFLMAMLDEYNSDSNQYRNRSPVEEAIIVPKRKHGRHICDDHDKLKRALAPSDVSFENTVDTVDKPNDTVLPKPTPPVNDLPSPAKPQRDFARYRNSLERESSTHQSLPKIETPIQPKPQYQKNAAVPRESLPTPPPRPIKTEPKELSSDSSLRPPLTPNISTSDSKLDNLFAQSLNNEKLDSALKKCNSSHSFLTPDLMDQIVNKVYGFQMNWDDHDGVNYSGYDDCSGQVAPSSKLKTRKISVIRKDQITEKPIVEDPAGESEKVADAIKLESTPTDGNETEVNDEQAKPSKFSIGNVSIKVSKNLPQTNPESMFADRSIPKTEENGQKMSNGNISNVCDIITKDSLNMVTPNIDLAVLPELCKIEDKKLVLEDSVKQVPAVIDDISSSTISSVSESNSKEVAGVTKPIELISETSNTNEHQTILKKSDAVIEKLFSDDFVKEVPAIIAERSSTSIPSVSEIISKEVATSSITKPADQISKPSNTNEHQTTLKKSDTVIEIQKLINHQADLESKAIDTLDILEDIYTKNRSRLNSFHNNFKESKPTADSETHGKNTDGDAQDVPTISDRRGSIIDHDEWFNDHREISKDDQPIRRDPESGVSYDTNSLFEPFGKRVKTFSESSEFFESSLTSAAEQQHLHDGSSENINDHSTLLKYLPAATK